MTGTGSGSGPVAGGRFDLVLSAAMLHHVLAWEKALAEAVRVLRRGGLLIGYDLLDTPTLRALHLGRGPGTRLLRPGQLEAELAQLAVTSVRTRRGAGGLVTRFTTRKTA